MKTIFKKGWASYGCFNEGTICDAKTIDQVSSWCVINDSRSSYVVVATLSMGALVSAAGPWGRLDDKN